MHFGIRAAANLQQGLCAKDPLSHALFTRHGHPCAHTTLFATIVPEYPKVIDGENVYETMASYVNGATVTNVLWRGKHH